MRIKNFKLERYFAKHEFTAKYLLSSSDCDSYSLKHVLSLASKETLHLWENLQFTYTESQGHPILREAILQYYQTNNIDNVVVASPGELNFIAMNVLLQTGDHAVTVSPCYQSLSEVVQSIPCEMTYWRPNSDNWIFDVTDLEALIQPNTKLIILNFPHNPTGSYLTITQLQKIIELARKQDIYIFSDEMYHKLVLGKSKALPPISDLYEKGISLWGTSKTFGLAGLRIGWLVSQDTTFLQQVVSFKDYLSICSSAPSEILSIIGLNNLPHFLKQNLQKIEQNVALFQNFAEKHSIIKSFIPPQAGSTAFVQLNIKESALEFSNKLVEQMGIMTLPAEMFDFDGKFIRIGFGRANLAQILDLLSTYLAKK